MKLRSITYLSKEGVKNMWANRLMTIASIGVLVACMVLIGLAMLISINLNQALGNLEEQNVVRVFFNDKTSVMYGESAEKNESSEASSSENDSSEPVASEDASSTNTTANGASEDTSSDAAQSENQADPDDIPDSAYTIHNEKEAQALCEKLEKLDNVVNVEYISGEDALKDYRENGQLPAGYDKYFEFDDEYGNPFSCGAEITLDDMGKFEATVKAIEGTKGVDSVRSYVELANKIESIKNGIGIAGVWIIAILLIISLVIVSNTIRVTMYSRKLEIGIMKAVGATNSFIRLPFIIEGIMIGLVSAAISLGVVYFCYRVAIESLVMELGTITPISFVSVLPTIIAVFIGIGVASGLLGSVIMIGKYLKKEGSEFTAI